MSREKHETTAGIVLLVFGIMATIGGIISFVEVGIVNAALPGFSISPVLPGAVLVIGLALITFALVERR